MLNPASEIVICAAHSVTRLGLAAMATTTISEVVGQVESLQGLSRWLQTQQADLAVVELLSPGDSEIELILDIAEALPDVLSAEESLSILALVEADWPVAESARLGQLMATGVVSLIPMGVSADGLRSVIAAILNGFTVLHPDISEAIFTSSRFASSRLVQSDSVQSSSSFDAVDNSEIEPLTEREIQVLNQLAGGLTNKAIAQALTISEHTVKFHMSAILAKLNVSSRTEAVAVGIRHGLVML